jgi:hypothetical protein
VLNRYRSSRSSWIDIEYFFLRYRYFRDLDSNLEHSISNYKTFDIKINIVSRYRRSFSKLIIVTLDIERFNFNIVIYRYRRSDARYRTLPRFQMLEHFVGRAALKLNLGRVGDWLEGEARRSSTGKVAHSYSRAFGSWSRFAQDCH